MPHYYTQSNDQLESLPKTVQFRVGNDLYQMVTDKGVFSKAGLDYGTRVLVEALFIKASDRVLDLGCGYGPIGIIIQKKFSAHVTMVDINQRAILLTKQNAKANHAEVTVVHSDGFSNVSGLFDWIITNPPIRAGKKVIYNWFETAKSFLSETGRLIIVINQKQGAPSALAFLKQKYAIVEIITKKSGFYVISCQK